MPDHLHALVGSQRKPSEVLRYVNGISGHRVINYLKENGFDSSLQKLRHEKATVSTSIHFGITIQTLVDNYGKRIDRESQLHPSESGPTWLVERAEDYRWSSIRCWQRRPLEDEPLQVDIDQIYWHKG